MESKKVMHPTMRIVKNNTMEKITYFLNIKTII